MGGIAGGASALGAGFGILSGVMGGQATNAADQFQAAELSQKAQVGQVAGVEENANITTRLSQSLANIDAVRAAGHNNPAGPEGGVVRDTTQMYGNTAKTIQVGNILEQSDMDTANANFLNSAGSFALTQGILSGVAGAAKGIGSNNFNLPSSGSFNFTNA